MSFVRQRGAFYWPQWIYRGGESIRSVEIIRAHGVNHMKWIWMHVWIRQQMQFTRFYFFPSPSLMAIVPSPSHIAGTRKFVHWCRYTHRQQGKNGIKENDGIKDERNNEEQAKKCVPTDLAKPSHRSDVFASFTVLHFPSFCAVSAILRHFLRDILDLYSIHVLLQDQIRSLRGSSLNFVKENRLEIRAFGPKSKASALTALHYRYQWTEQNMEMYLIWLHIHFYHISGNSAWKKSFSRVEHPTVETLVAWMAMAVKGELKRQQRPFRTAEFYLLYSPWHHIAPSVC